jgi:hypothetical protein
VTATVSGTAFSGNLATAAVHQSGILSFAGTQTASGQVRQFNITLTSATATGTFTFGPGSFNTAIYSETTGTKSMPSLE